MSQTICPGCGRTGATTRELTDYSYLASGLPNVRLLGGVIETSCRRCGETHVRVEKEWQLLQVIALGLFMTPNRLTGQEIRFLRGACQLTQQALAKLTRHRRETIAERESRQDPGVTAAEETWLRLVLLDAFRRHLAEPGNDFLSASHRRRLQEFARSFCERATHLAETPRRRRVLRVQCGRDWKLEDAA